jgi:hypothetical protein
MARKKTNRKYSRSVFSDVVCQKCGLCTDPSFCYTFYKKNPARFFEHCYPQLINIKTWPSSKGKSKRLFKKIFCSSGTCGKRKKNGRKCSDLKNCQWSFYPTTLTLVGNGTGIGANIKEAFGTATRKRRRKKKKKYIVAAYPTFFCSDNDEWKREIQEALNDNTDTEKQDRSVESSSQS